MTRTNFSLSPRHFETMDDADMLKKVVRHSVATALASMVLPVPHARVSTERKKLNDTENVFGSV